MCFVNVGVSVLACVSVCVRVLKRVCVCVSASVWREQKMVEDLVAFWLYTRPSGRSLLDCAISFP